MGPDDLDGIVEKIRWLVLDMKTFNGFIFFEEMQGLIRLIAPFQTVDQRRIFCKIIMIWASVRLRIRVVGDLVTPWFLAHSLLTVVCLMFVNFGEVSPMNMTQQSSSQDRTWKHDVASYPGHSPACQNMERTLRVLLVEDAPFLRYAFGRLLRLEGFEVKEVNDGREALDCLSHFRPDLVLTDLMMPVMGGVELISKIRADPQYATVPIVAITADATEQAERNARRAGAVDVITKPIDLTALLDRLRVLVH